MSVHQTCVVEFWGTSILCSQPLPVLNQGYPNNITQSCISSQFQKSGLPEGLTLTSPHYLSQELTIG